MTVISCGVVCDYYNRPHAEEHGMLGLTRESKPLLIASAGAVK